MKKTISIVSIMPPFAQIISFLSFKGKVQKVVFSGYCSFIQDFSKAETKKQQHQKDRPKSKAQY